MVNSWSSTTRRFEGADARRWLALVVVCLAQLMNTLDATIVNVSLPTIQADLGFSQANLSPTFPSRAQQDDSPANRPAK